jgi:RNA polymerase sigma factor (sigma-70 family)
LAVASLLKLRKPMPGDQQSPLHLETLILQGRQGSQRAVSQLLLLSQHVVSELVRQELARTPVVDVEPGQLALEIILQAQLDFESFRGSSRQEWENWLVAMLRRNLASRRNHGSDTVQGQWHEKVEMPSIGQPEKPAAAPLTGRMIPANPPAPTKVIGTLDEALAGLPERTRSLIIWRNRERRTFEEIGQALECSAEAARQQWAQAIEQLMLSLPDMFP